MGRFTVLDSFRGLCACLVALMHFPVLTHLAASPFIANSFLFVDFFFVLSGFVIAFNYQERLAEGFGVLKFMLLRFGRLYPLHLATLAAFVAVEIVQFVPAVGRLSNSAPFSTEGNSVYALFTNTFLLHSLGLHGQTTWNGPSWSISTEFYTYLLFAVVFIVFKSRILWCLLPVVALSPFIIALYYPYMNTTYDFGFVRCVYGFAAGVLACMAYRRWSAAVSQRIDRLSIATALELALVVAIVAFVGLMGRERISLMAPFIFAAAVFVFSFELGGVSKLLRCGPMVLLGTLSYSIYMVHVFIAFRFLDVARLVQKFTGIRTTTNGEGGNLLVGADYWQGYPVQLIYLLAVIGVSYLTFHYIEKPARNWFRSRSYGVAKAPKETAAPAPV